MIQLLKSDYGADEFQQRVDLFCFTDVRLEITPEQSMKLQEQLLRLSDLFTGIIADYFSSSHNNRFTSIAIKSNRLSKRFDFIGKALAQEKIDPASLLLFKRELATEVYADCKNLDDRNLYYSLNTFLYKQTRGRKRQDEKPV
jgi:hypothetical protein